MTPATAADSALPDLPNAREIARQARSNLAFALVSLPATRRRDMITFYAFCRVVDDLADNEDSPLAVRRQELERWRQAILGELPSPHPLLSEVLALCPVYDIPPTLLVEIIDGVSSDLERLRFHSYDELLHYCYQVASAVGLVSIRIFGSHHPDTERYALHMGYALQLTNIIRDVGQDARETGRIYLPLEDLKKHGVTEAQILEGRQDAHFNALMEDYYQRARRHYQLAEDLLPEQDRQVMIAAEMMGQIYFEILLKIKQHNFPCLHTRIRLHPLRKAVILLGYLFRGFIRAI